MPTRFESSYACDTFHAMRFASPPACASLPASPFYFVSAFTIFALKIDILTIFLKAALLWDDFCRDIAGGPSNIEVSHASFEHTLAFHDLFTLSYFDIYLFWFLSMIITFRGKCHMAAHRAFSILLSAITFTGSYEQQGLKYSGSVIHTFHFIPCYPLWAYFFWYGPIYYLFDAWPLVKLLDFWPLSTNISKSYVTIFTGLPYASLLSSRSLASPLQCRFKCLYVYYHIFQERRGHLLFCLYYIFRSCMRHAFRLLSSAYLGTSFILKITMSPPHHRLPTIGQFQPAVMRILASFIFTAYYRGHFTFAAARLGRLIAAQKAFHVTSILCCVNIGCLIYYFRFITSGHVSML